MRKHIVLSALVAVSIALGGCSVEEIQANIQHFIGLAEADIGLAEAAIAQNCAAITLVQSDIATGAAQFGTCKAKTNAAKATAAINSVCQDARLINATNVSAISVQVSNAYKAAKAAQAGGC